MVPVPQPEDVDGLGVRVNPEPLTKLSEVVANGRLPEAHGMGGCRIGAVSHVRTERRQLAWRRLERLSGLSQLRSPQAVALLESTTGGQVDDVSVAEP